MLNFDVNGLEDFIMEEQVHLTITATICGCIFVVIYYFSTLNESYIAHEVAMMRESMGLKDGDAPARQAPVKLGPHSYMTLLLSMVCCAITLFLIYLIKVTPFETLIKMTPIHKLIQILVNSPELEEEEDGRRRSQAGISSRERVLATCMELEKRMTRLEQCLGPLVHSLELLTQHADFQSVQANPDNATLDTSRANMEAGPAGAATQPDSANSRGSPERPASSGLRKRSTASETPGLN